MNTHTNQDTTELPQISLMTKIKIAIIGGVMLSIGFITSLFLLMISAIMLPFAAIKLWFLKEKFDEAMQAQSNTEANNPSSDKTSHDRVFEGEYVAE